MPQACVALAFISFLIDPVAKPGHSQHLCLRLTITNQLTSLDLGRVVLVATSVYRTPVAPALHMALSSDLDVCTPLVSRTLISFVYLRMHPRFAKLVDLVEKTRIML
jgi:hypothetical protein